MRELISGKNSVLDAIKNKLNIKIIYTTRPEQVQGFDKVKIVDKRFLDKLVKGNHQGLVAELINFDYSSFEDIISQEPGKILILDHIQDPRNLGAILRSANAFGWKHIIMPQDRAAKITSAAIKTSSGGYVGLNIARVKSLQSTLDKLKKLNYWTYATALNEESQPIDKITFNKPVVVIIGNEEKGVSNTLIKHSDQTFFIPTKGTVQSLNVSVATGIILSSI